MIQQPKRDEVFMNKDNEWLRFLAKREPLEPVLKKTKKPKNLIISRKQKRGIHGI